jgi:hypothetical protein
MINTEILLKKSNIKKIKKKVKKKLRFIDVIHFFNGIITSKVSFIY